MRSFRSLSRLGAIALVAFALCAMATISVGQMVNTRVTGTVKDQADAVIPGVKVTLTDTKTKDPRTATTNEDGVFVFTDVRPGTYSILIEHPGFKKLLVQNVVTHVDVPAILSLTLETGGVAEIVLTPGSEGMAGM